MSRPQNAPICQNCGNDMIVIKRGISPTGVSTPKTAECRECNLRWRRGAGLDRVATDGGDDRAE